MVRLKGKRSKILQKKFTRFQFLMVRLKVKPSNRQAYSPIIFQFLMVRLKAHYTRCLLRIR